MTGTKEWCVIIDIAWATPNVMNFFRDTEPVTPLARVSQVDCTRAAGEFYWNPNSQIVTFVLKNHHIVSFEALEVVQVSLGLAVTFDDFFADNEIDPAILDSSLAETLPVGFAGTYDPGKGNIVKQDPFVANMAAVLNINPDRIKVTSIVPGNGRRRRLQGGQPGITVGTSISANPANATANANATAAGGSPANATSGNTAAFDELLTVATALINATESGGLDVGYEVESIAVTLPADVCGVPGGAGDTCFDACRVANGDNSTCADYCGVPNGDGSSCPAPGAPVSFTSCYVNDALVDYTERFRVNITADGSGSTLSGTYTLAFNGDTTEAIAVLESNDTIGA